MRPKQTAFVCALMLGLVASSGCLGSRHRAAGYRNEAMVIGIMEVDLAAVTLLGGYLIATRLEDRIDNEPSRRDRLQIAGGVACICGGAVLLYACERWDRNVPRARTWNATLGPNAVALKYRF